MHKAIGAIVGRMTSLIMVMGLVIFSSSLYSAELARYEFENGSTITDSSGNGMNGVIVGKDWVESDTFKVKGYSNNAKSFNNSAYDTYMSIPHNTLFNCFGEKFTLECWYQNTGAPSSGVGRIIGKGNAYDFGFDLRIGNDRKISWVVVFGNGNGKRIYLNSTVPITDGVWYHIAVTAEEIINGNQIDLKLCIYLNGKLNVSFTKTDSGGMLTNTEPLQMMGAPKDKWFSRGIITRVRISDMALTKFDVE